MVYSTVNLFQNGQTMYFPNYDLRFTVFHFQNGQRVNVLDFSVFQYPIILRIVSTFNPLILSFLHLSWI